MVVQDWQLQLWALNIQINSNENNFSNISNDLSIEILNQHGKHLKQIEVKAYVRVRSKATQKGNRISYLDVPTLKPDLFQKVVSLRNVVPKDPFNAHEPQEPVQNMSENVATNSA